MAMTIELSTASLIYWLNFHAHHHAHCDTHRDLHTPDYTPFALTHNIAVWFTPGAGAAGAQRGAFYAARPAPREAPRAPSTPPHTATGSGPCLVCSVMCIVATARNACNLQGPGARHTCHIYTTDTPHQTPSVDLGGRRIIKKK